MPKTQCPHGDGSGEPCIRCAMDEVPVLPIYLYFILDVSPSMRSRWPQTISGLNEYMDSLRQDQRENDQPYVVTLVTFSADVKKTYDEVELDAIPTFTEDNLKPHGWGTALYDAIGQTVQGISTTNPVLVVTLTDGAENSSRSWDEDRVSTLTDQRQALTNYTFVYLGVDKAAWGNATKLGTAVASNVNNLHASDYSTGTFSGQANSLSTRTVAYSAAVRVGRRAGTSMSVSHFFDPAQFSQALQEEDAVTPEAVNPVTGE